MSTVGGARERKMVIPFARLNSVYVGRLPQSWTEEHLFELFSQIGHITNIRLVRDPFTHESRKFGYVEFEAKASVKVAIRKLHKSEVKPGHQLNVEPCHKVSQIQEEKALLEAERLRREKIRPAKHLSKNAKRKLAYKEAEARQALSQRLNDLKKVAKPSSKKAAESRSMSKKGKKSLSHKKDSKRRK